MSQTYSLVCHETQQRVWVGQGWGKMESFYSGDPETMKRLGTFLAAHEGHTLVLLCNDTNEFVFDYRDWGDGTVAEEQVAAEAEGKEALDEAKRDLTGPPMTV